MTHQEDMSTDANKSNASDTNNTTPNAINPNTNPEDTNAFSDAAYLNMDLLRFTTAGSVDDGKSTLIGRLLYDSKSIFEDQMEAIEKTSQKTGEEGVNLALLTDGLRAEREQKITIDVAYRYFATPKRKFIIADTPGHEQYTRNMVTGASTADLAIILIDAKNGITTQSKRHAFISSLLQIPHIVVAINKMDLVDYSEERFNEIRQEFQEVAKKIDSDDITFIPMSALLGDNIVHKGDNMPWYSGATLLHTLENVKIGSRKNSVDFRLPVQYVIRPNQDFRGFSGTISSGTIRQGDNIIALPSMRESKVKEIWMDQQPVDQAKPGDAVVLTMEDELDISRGDMIVRKGNVPTMRQEVEAQLCWMHPQPMVPGKTYLMMHTTRVVQVIPRKLTYRMDINTMHREEAETLQLNEIGRVEMVTAQPLFFDPYRLNNETGSFVLIDPATKVTIAAGMIRPGSTTSAESKGLMEKQPDRSPNVVWEPWNIPREEREARNGHESVVLWFTGISGAGKSTIAKALETSLWKDKKQTMLLDGDQVRHGLNGDLGFTDSDRAENIRRIGEVSRLFFEHGNIVLCTFVSPFRNDRDRVRELFPEGKFIEIHVTCNPKTAQERDPKGLYDKAKRGELQGLTGFDATYEVPVRADLTLNTDKLTVEQAVEMIRGYLEQ